MNELIFITKLTCKIGIHIGVGQVSSCHKLQLEIVDLDLRSPGQKRKREREREREREKISQALQVYSKGQVIYKA